MKKEDLQEEGGRLEGRGKRFKKKEEPSGIMYI